VHLDGRCVPGVSELIHDGRGDVRFVMGAARLQG
jgi:hypothetical protein